MKESGKHLPSVVCRVSRPWHANKIVVRYTDGRVLKGYSQNFLPNRRVFHLLPPKAGPSDRPHQIEVPHLKAVFFVRDFDSSVPDNDGTDLEPQPGTGRPVEVTFSDGEVMVGSALSYNPEKSGFFLFPRDPESNNHRVFVVVSATREIRWLS